MNQTGFGQVDQGLRIAGFTTACLFILLASAAFGFSPTAALTGVGALTLALVLPRVIPWVATHIAALDFFSPYVVFPIAYVIWFVGGSINFITLPIEIGSGPFDPVPAWMYGLYACGLAGFFLGMFAGTKPTIRNLEPGSRQLDIAKIRRIVNFVFIGAVVFWALTGLQFGIPLLHPGTANTDRLALHGPLYQSFIYLSFTAFIFSPIFTWARGGKQRYDWIPVIAVPAILSSLLISLGGRSNVVGPLITVVIARSYFKKQSVLKLAAGGVVGFCVFSAIGYFREASASDYAPIQDIVEYVGIPPSVVPVIYTSVYLRYTVAALRDLTQMVPSQTPYRYGAITLLPLTTFLPGHRDMSDIVFKNMLGREFEGSGLPATILGPLYVDFGWVGVFLGMSFYGLLLSWTYRRVKSQPTATRIISYAWWLQSSLIGIYCNGFVSILIFILPLFWSILYFFAKPKWMPPEAAIEQLISA